MLFQRTQQQQIIDRIREGKTVADKGELQDLLDACKQWRPPGYDEHQHKVRDYYTGHSKKHTLRALQKRFPSTWPKMTLVDFNFTKLYAEEASAVFDEPWTYRLRPHGDDDVSEDEAESFADMLEAADLAAVLPEAERRTKVAKTVWLRVHPDVVTAAATGDPPQIKVDIYWPGDVFVLPHPSAPTSTDALIALVARAGGEGGAQRWEVWTRTFTEEEGAVSSFGPWRAEVFSVEGGKVARHVFWEEWPEAVGLLPWVPYHDDVLDGLPVVDPPRNILDAVDAINTGMANEAMMADFSAAPLLLRKTDDPQPATIAIGPGTMTDVPRQDDIVSISQSADFAGVRAVTRATAGMLALTSRQRIEGLDVEATASALSGIALRIKNEPQEKARRESVNRARAMVQRLLRVLCLCSDAFAGTSLLDAGWPDYEPSEPQDHEEKEARQRRVESMLALGLITKARALVLLGMARDEADARMQIEEIQDERRSPQGRMAAAIMATVEDVLEQEAAADVAEVAEAPTVEQQAQPVAPVENVQQQALNGAQTDALRGVIDDITTGKYSVGVGRVVIKMSNPAVDEALLRELEDELRKSPPPKQPEAEADSGG
jgi:hypothetical protein